VTQYCVCANELDKAGQEKTSLLQQHLLTSASCAVQNLHW